MVLQNNGRIILGGSVGSVFSVVRLLSNGALDTSFGTRGVATILVPNPAPELGAILSQVNGITEDVAGDILAVGMFGLPDSNLVGSLIARYLPSGKADKSFGSAGMVQYDLDSPVADLDSVAVTGNGKILEGGGALNAAVASLNHNGTPNTSFGTGGVAYLTNLDGSSGMIAPPVLALAVQSDGKILAAFGSNLVRLTG